MNNLDFILSWSECIWYLKLNNADNAPEELFLGDFKLHKMSLTFGGVSLGEAGNTTRNWNDFPTAMRVGDEVLVSSKTASGHFKRKYGTVAQIIIPASTKVKGFGEEKNGKTLLELLEEGEVYDYQLNKLSA